MDELGNAGSPMIGLGEVPDNIQYFAPYEGNKNIDLFTLRREEVSNAGVNQTVKATIVINSDSLDAYNEANETNFSALPDSIYTLVTGKGVEEVADGIYEITFQPGVTAVPFTVNVNGSKWDLSQTYGFYFVLQDAGGKTVKYGTAETMAAIAITNQYDGYYIMKGHHNRSPYDFEYEVEMLMATVGINKVAFYWPEAGSVGHPIGVGEGEVSWYGASIAPIIEFDVETNKITNVYNAAGDPVISLYTDATGPGAMSNLYDPETQTIYVSWMYNNNPQRAFFDELKFSHSR
ncbi:hypothetical protein GCM10027051_12240 [Niabella terrae]